MSRPSAMKANDTVVIYNGQGSELTRISPGQARALREDLNRILNQGEGSIYPTPHIVPEEEYKVLVSNVAKLIVDLEEVKGRLSKLEGSESPAIFDQFLDKLGRIVREGL